MEPIHPPPGDRVHPPPTGVADRYQWVMQPTRLAALRRVFHGMNRGMVLLWRLGLGRMTELWPRGSGRLLVIEHVGRRSGAQYRTPVNFTRDGGNLYCVAAFGERTDWFRNVLASGDLAVWLPDGRWEATADDASHDPRRLTLMRKVLVDSGFAAPLFGLHPTRATDSELAVATASYCLLRIRPQQRAHGHGGPGDLTWTWLALPLGLLWRAVRRKGRRA